MRGNRLAAGGAQSVYPKQLPSIIPPLLAFGQLQCYNNGIMAIRPAREQLDGHFVETLESDDVFNLFCQLDDACDMDSPTSRWLETIGLRLRLRDVYSRQKGLLAHLGSIDTDNMTVAKKAQVFEEGFITRLDAVAGSNSRTGIETCPPDKLRHLRIRRLMRERQPGLMNLLRDYGELPFLEMFSLRSTLLEARTVSHNLTDELGTASYYAAQPESLHAAIFAERAYWTDREITDCMVQVVYGNREP